MDVLLILCFISIFTSANPYVNPTVALMIISSNIKSGKPTIHISTSFDSESTALRRRRDIKVDTLEELCEILKEKISKEDCNCKHPAISNFPFCKSSPTVDPNEINLEYNERHTKIYAAITITASGIGIIGNSLVVAIAVKVWKTLNKVRKIIAYLAFTDLTFATFQLVSIIPLLWTNQYLYGTYGCKILNPAKTLGHLLSIGIIVIIFIERFFGIVFPFGVRGKEIPDHVWIVSLLVNVSFSVGSVIPLIMYSEININKRCIEKWPNKEKDSTIFSWYVMISYFIVPVLIIAILYVFIFRALRFSVSEKNLSMIPDSHQREQRRKEIHRVMLILVLVVITFVILAFPQRLFTLIVDIHLASLSKHSYLLLSTSLKSISSFQVAANPVLYSILDKKWRKELVSIFPVKPRRVFSQMGPSFKTSQFDMSKVEERHEKTRKEVMLTTLADTKYAQQGSTATLVIDVANAKL